MLFSDLSGKVVIVTGGSSGIGLGICEGLAAMGCDVAIWARDPEKNRKALVQLGEKSASVQAFQCDVTSPSDVRSALQQTLRHFGRIDGCFANAGIGGGRGVSVLERSLDDWRRYHAVNVEGVVACFQLIGKYLQERSIHDTRCNGRLVATSSIASRLATTRNEHYAASKAALNAVVRSFALELAPYRITVNAILPGFVATSMTAGMQADPVFQNGVSARIPLGRMAAPGEFAGIAAYLMSEKSSYHTGDCITIDGGFSIS